MEPAGATVGEQQFKLQGTAIHPMNKTGDNCLDSATYEGPSEKKSNKRKGDILMDLKILSSLCKPHLFQALSVRVSCYAALSPMRLTPIKVD